MPRSRLRTRWLWHRQGRPKHQPVVVAVGELLINPDGTRTMTHWAWDFRYYEGRLPWIDIKGDDDQTGLDEFDQIWEYMAKFTTPRWVRDGA